MISYRKLFLLCMLLCSFTTAAHAGKLRDLLRGDTGSTASNNAKVLKNISYGSDPDQKMDVYLPIKPTNTDAPVIFMVHGGGWQHGDKDNNRVVDNKVERWVSQGLIFISINYPMLPEADVAAQENSVILALAEAQRKAPEWGGNASKFILMGHSAGAHLVSLLNANPQPAISAGALPWLGTVSLDSAALDVPAVMNMRHLPLYDKAFGTDTRYWESLSPIHQLRADSPPLLAVCSTQRRDNPCRQAEHYKQAAGKLSRPVDILPEDLSHGEINQQLGLDSDYTKTVERFMAGLDDAVANRITSR